jgi:hypothetical protein
MCFSCNGSGQRKGRRGALFVIVRDESRPVIPRQVALQHCSLLFGRVTSCYSIPGLRALLRPEGGFQRLQSSFLQIDIAQMVVHKADQPDTGLDLLDGNGLNELMLMGEFCDPLDVLNGRRGKLS